MLPRTKSTGSSNTNPPPSASPQPSPSAAFHLPYAAKLLLDTDPKVVAEAAHAIYDDPAITAAYPALAELIAKNPKATIPAARRSIAANRYLADEKSAARLAIYAADASVETSLRIAALEALASWTEASELNPVDGRYDPLKPADVAIAKAAFQPEATILQHDPDKAIGNAAAKVSKSLGIVASIADLEKEAFDTNADPAARIRSLDALLSADPKRFSKFASGLLKDKIPALRTHAASLIAEKDPATAIAYAKEAIAKSKDIPERQQAVLLLGKMKDPAAKSFLKELATTPENRPGNPP